jgi:hypothetical protein
MFQMTYEDFHKRVSEIVRTHHSEVVMANLVILELERFRLDQDAAQPNVQRTASHVHHFVLDDEHPTYESCECGEIRRR